MFDPSIEDLREYVNNYKLNNNHETNTRNEATQHLSDDELIKLLESESDTSGNADEQSKTAQHLTEKTVNNNVDVQNGSSVLKVAVNDVEGLTLEIRESFYSKLCNALSTNYKTIFSKKGSSCLTESNIFDIAKKMEYGILSTAKDLNSYKLAGADAVINIEKETCYGHLYKSLFNEIELLRLLSKMQTATSENPQQEQIVLSTETESSSCKESEFEDAQSKTESMEVYTINNNSVKLLDTQNTVVSESEYFSCNSADHNSVESQQNTVTCTIASNTQEPIIDLPREKHFKEVEKSKNGELRSISANNSVSVWNNKKNVRKIPIESSNVSSGTDSSNAEKELHSVGDKGISKKKRRKQKVQCDSEPSTNSLPVQQNKCNVDNRSKKQKLMEREMVLETSVTTTDANNKNKEKPDFDLKDCSEMRLHSKVEKMDESLPCLHIELKQEFINKEPMSPIPTDSLCNQHNKEQTSLEKHLTSKAIYKKRCELNNNEINSINDKNRSQGRINKLFPPNVMCTIKAGLDLSQFSIGLKNEELFNEKLIDGVAVKNGRSSSVHEVSSNGLEDNAVLQHSENNLESGAISSTHVENSTEVTATEERSVPDVNASIDSHESNVVKENNCLIDEKAFELERARLDKLCEEIKKNNEESYVDIIHGDYKKIFRIIIPIIRKYYPSEYIPDEVCYGHILQNLQIDLTHTDMSDDDIALYTKDSIKTRRYLYQNCIVQ